MNRLRASALILFASAPAFSQQAGDKSLGAESVPPETMANYAAPPLDSAVSRRRLHFGWRITGTPQGGFPRITRPALQERPAFSFADDLRQRPGPERRITPETSML